MTFTFTPATREQARARIGLQGPAGCGKTKSALRIAEGLAQGGRIGLIDTERRSALTYAIVPGQPHLGGHEFGHMPMDSYDPRNLIKAVQAAQQAELAVLIVDSWSHFWNGRGGLLEIVEQAGSGALGTFGGWKKGNPIEQDMLDALLNFSGHLIVTMRTKTDYLIDDSGPKKKITKVGTKVVQRETSDYELGLIIDMVEGIGTVIKTRYETLDGLSILHPGEELGRQILEQLGQGVDPVGYVRNALKDAELTYPGALALYEYAKQRGILETVIPATDRDQPDDVLGELIKARGIELKGEAAPSTPSQQQAPTPPAPPEPTPPAPDPLKDLLAEVKAHWTDAALLAQDGLTAKRLNLVDATVQQADGSTVRLGEMIQARVAQLSASKPAAPIEQPDEADRVTSPQMKKMHATFNDLGIKDRAERLLITSGIVGREVPSANSLSKGEGRHLIDFLEGLATAEPEARTAALAELLPQKAAA